MLVQAIHLVFRLRDTSAQELLSSSLFNEDTLYPALTKGLNNCGSELIIESPFITNRRLVNADFAKTETA